MWLRFTISFSKTAAAFAVALIFGMGLAGCVSTPRQSDQLLNWQSANLSVPLSHEIQDVPFIDQAAGFCGPATLAMAMNFHGKSVDVNQLATQVFTPGLKGSLQTDLISAGRRQGMLAIPIEGFPALVAEVASGSPVIIYENLGVSWYQQWHYALVIGYDIGRKEIRLHSGPDANSIESMKVFENSWRLGRYWGLLILPPGQLSASAGELAHATAAAALEQQGLLEQAKLSYLAIIKKWPSSLGALIGLGNVFYQQKEYEVAVKYLRQAKAAHPDVPAVLQNLKVAETALKK